MRRLVFGLGLAGLLGCSAGGSPAGEDATAGSGGSGDSPNPPVDAGSSADADGAGPAGDLAGENLLDSARFERGAAGEGCPEAWTCATYRPPGAGAFAIDDAVSLVGDRSARWEADEETPGTVIRQDLPARPGTAFELSAQVRSEGLTEAPFVQILFDDAAGDLVTGERFFSSGDATGEWERIGGEITAPPQTARVRFNLSTDGTAGTVWWDDAALVAHEDDVPANMVRLDYADYDAPSEVYNINDNRSGIAPAFVSSPSFISDQALRTEFSGSQKTANVEFRFGDHEMDDPEEVYTRFYVYPEDIELPDSATVRMFWLPLTNGPGSSGGGATDGTNGWSNAIGFSHRNGSPAPDGYNFFSYAYHMDRGGSGDFEMTSAPVWMDEWNLIEGYVRANTHAGGVANHDGVMRYWVNGELAFERTDLRMTVSDDNTIEGVGPLGYVVGANLSGSALVYDGHTIVLGGVPGDAEAVRAAHQEHLASSRSP